MKCRFWFDGMNLLKEAIEVKIGIFFILYFFICFHQDRHM